MMTQRYSLEQEDANGVDKVNDESTMLRVQSNEKQDIDRSIKILELRNFQSVQYACHDAYKNHKFIGIAGDPGLGKTTALRYFRDHNENVFLITVTASMSVKDFWITVYETIYEYRVKSFKEFGNNSADEEDKDFWRKYNHLRDLASDAQTQMINIRNNQNIHFIIKQIIRQLNSTGGLIIFDEAGKVKTTRFLEMVHFLRDSTCDDVGLILAGPEYFKRQLQIWVNKNVNGIPELWSRIQLWFSLEIPTREDVKEFCIAYGVKDNEVIKDFQSTRNYRLLYNRVINYLEELADGQD